MEGETNCTCGKPPGSNRFMIYCDGCNYWLHGSCVGVKRTDELSEKWFCPRCRCPRNEVSSLKVEIRYLKTFVEDAAERLQRMSTEKSAKDAAEFRDLKVLVEDAVERCSRMSTEKISKDAAMNRLVVEEDCAKDVREREATISNLLETIEKLSKDLAEKDSRNAAELEVIKRNHQILTEEHAKEVKKKEITILKLEETIKKLTEDLKSQKATETRTEIKEINDHFLSNDSKTQPSQHPGKRLSQEEVPKRKNRLSLKKPCLSQPQLPRPK